MIELGIDLSDCKSKVEIINKIYDSLEIISPRGLNWDALYENLRNIGNISSAYKKTKTESNTLGLTITGLHSHNEISNDDARVFTQILIDSTEVTQRIDNIRFFVRIAS
jgi:hypothetical protein